MDTTTIFSTALGIVAPWYVKNNVKTNLSFKELHENTSLIDSLLKKDAFELGYNISLIN